MLKNVLQILGVGVDVNKKKGAKGRGDITLSTLSSNEEAIAAAAEGKKTKIRLQDFKIGQSRRIADLGNKHMRGVISLSNGFPEAYERPQLAWSSAVEACKSDMFLTRELKDIKKNNPRLRGDLVEYVRLFFFLLLVPSNTCCTRSLLRFGT